MERDRRGYRLSLGGCLLTLVAFVLAITATISNSWATFIGKSRLPFVQTPCQYHNEEII